MGIAGMGWVWVCVGGGGSGVCVCWGGVGGGVGGEGLSQFYSREPSHLNLMHLQFKDMLGPHRCPTSSVIHHSETETRVLRSQKIGLTQSTQELKS